MKKEFVSFQTVRNNALKLAHKIHGDGFVPNVIYCSLRGGAYLANVISEYYKIACPERQPILYAAVSARSYSNVRAHGQVHIDGWTYPPEQLRKEDKIMLVDDIFDSGNTINSISRIFLSHGLPRQNIKIAVHDYKYFSYRQQLQIQPDYWCRKFEIAKPEDDLWIHYTSHELVGLSAAELEEHYFGEDKELRSVLEPLLAGK